jgi:hypothetical protein
MFAKKVCVSDEESICRVLTVFFIDLQIITLGHNPYRPATVIDTHITIPSRYLVTHICTVYGVYVIVRQHDHSEQVLGHACMYRVWCVCDPAIT